MSLTNKATFTAPSSMRLLQAFLLPVFNIPAALAANSTDVFYFMHIPKAGGASFTDDLGARKHVGASAGYTSLVVRYVEHAWAAASCTTAASTLSARGRSAATFTRVRGITSITSS